MSKLLLKVVACASVMFFAASANAMPVEYDQNIYVFHEGANDPTTESTNWVLDVGSNPGVVSSGPGTETIGPNTYDYWFTDDSGSGASEYLRYTETISAAQALNPWSLRARVRSVGTSSTDQSLILYDGTDRWGVWIRDNQLLTTNSPSVTILNSNFASDYREIELLYNPVTPGVTNSADFVEIYVDQVLAGSFTRATALNSGTAPSLFFGGNSSAGTGRINWNRIEFVEGATLGFAQIVPQPIPEPSTLGLLALGGVFLMRRRRSAGLRNQPVKE